MTNVEKLKWACCLIDARKARYQDDLAAWRATPPCEAELFARKLEGEYSSKIDAAKKALPPFYPFFPGMPGYNKAAADAERQARYAVGREVSRLEDEFHGVIRVLPGYPWAFEQPASADEAEALEYIEWLRGQLLEGGGDKLGDSGWTESMCDAAARLDRRALREERHAKYTAICEMWDYVWDPARARDYETAIVRAGEMLEAEEAYLAEYPTARRVFGPWKGDMDTLQNENIVERVREAAERHRQKEAERSALTAEAHAKEDAISLAIIADESGNPTYNDFWVWSTHGNVYRSSFERCMKGLELDCSVEELLGEGKRKR